ncbi:hypothetical protein AC579_1738 [Pseudocercospora musae]|uniref:Uncharacterized protein n=1 Tax=Pseudocercospora musae TaxID=113226 RepID=A0A139IES9_9PEZI|nr:hypothetical protein AC579_1738 [Pseudocercospora musae]
MLAIISVSAEALVIELMTALDFFGWIMTSPKRRGRLERLLQCTLSLNSVDAGTTGGPVKLKVTPSLVPSLLVLLPASREDLGNDCTERDLWCDDVFRGLLQRYEGFCHVWERSTRIVEGCQFEEKDRLISAASVEWERNICQVFHFRVRNLQLSLGDADCTSYHLQGLEVQARNNGVW